MRHWKYKNLTFFVVSIIIAYLVLRDETLHSYLLHLGTLGYIGAFFAGILFVSTFTVTTGAVILLILAETLSPFEIGIVAGVGAVLGDLLIFRFVKNELVGEVKLIYNKIDSGHHLKKLFHTKYFAWTLPVIGAAIIASPLPDEIGVSLMGISRLSTFKFLIISFVLNALGIFLVVSASVVIKP